MFEDDSHEDVDLFDNDPDEGVSTDASTNEELDLDIEESKEAKSQDAEIVRQKTVESFQKKYDSGQITLDSIPASSKWVIKHLNLEKERVSKKSETDLDQLLEQKFAKMENDKEFARLKAQIESLPLSKAQKLTLNEEFKEFRSIGAPTAKALKKAIAVAQIQLDDYSSKKAAMRIPTPGYAGSQEETNEDSPYEFEGDDYKGAKGTPEQRIAYLEKNRNAAQGSDGLKAYQRYGKK